MEGWGVSGEGGWGIYCKDARCRISRFLVGWLGRGFGN